ncbi:MAG: hypothetical protein GXO61_00005, partial [Epsilonproteobacteria bacterium]|nr:hypothetical protein [Campylobacterota bacterium]
NVDGYTYLEGARDINAGFHQENDLSKINSPLSKLLAYTHQITGISLDTLGLYLPGIIGSLIVIPLILIGRALGILWVGFLSALLAGIAWSYYHRTMYGYLDTDMLTVVLPTFAVWGMVEALRNNRYWLIAPLFVILMKIWHPGLHHIANGMFLMGVIYLLYLHFIKKEDIYKKVFFLVLYLIALLPLSPLILLITIIGVYFLYTRKIEKTTLPISPLNLIGIVTVGFLLIIGLPWISTVIKSAYFTRDVTDDVGNIHYYEVVNTVREAGRISWDLLVHRISGSWLGFLLGVIGYIWLLIRYPVMIVSLPMVVLGFFALQGGLRFTVFAVPFIALGDAYLFWRVGEKIASFVKNFKFSNYLPYFLSAILMGGVIYPNYKHVHQYITPTTFNKEEVEILEKFKTIAKREDYVLTWWDYGYPIRYYADVKTLIDGGKHSGNVNYPVSFALTRPQLPSYNMAILDVYFTELHFRDKKPFDIVKDIMNYYNLKSIDEVEPFLYKKIPLPSIKEDIYYYLPLRMLNIFPTVALFSYIDLKTGKLRKNPFYIQTTIKGKGNQGEIVLSNGILIYPNGTIKLGKQLIPINTFVTTLYNPQGKFEVIKQQGDSNSPVFVIWMRSYNKLLIMDKDFYNSSFIQMFVLENYDKSLFEPVILNPWVKIYKVKK